jgi:hypothetical protein
MDQKSLHRICTFVPVGNRSDPASGTIAELIMMALSLSPSPRSSSNAIQKTIAELTSGIFVSQPEIDAALAALTSAKSIERHHEIADAFLYSASDEKRQKAQDELIAIENEQKYVRATIATFFSSQSDSSLQQNASTLALEAENHLKEVVRVNGVLAARSFYGHSEQTDDLVPEVSAASRPPTELVAIRKAVTACFRSSDQTVRKYILRLVRAGVAYAALHLDPKCSQLLCRPLRLKQTKLFIDTNVIFRLLGLNGDFFRQGAIDVVKASRELGCQLLVAGETLREYKATLKGHLADSKLRMLPKSPELLNVLSDTLDEFDFRLAYLQERKKRGVGYTPELFQERHLAIESDIRDLGVKILPNATDKIPDSDPALLSLHSRYNTWINGHTANRTAEAISHDVRLLEYVRREQLSSATTIDEAGIVFLTSDRLLARFAATEFNRIDRRHVPACISVETWMQYVAPLLPRLSDYEAGFLNFLSAPFVTRSPLSFDDAAQVLARIESQSERSDEAVIEMLYGKRAETFAIKITGKGQYERERIIDSEYSDEVIKIENRHAEELAARDLAHRAAREAELTEFRKKSDAERDVLTVKIEEESAGRRNIAADLESERATRAALESKLDKENNERLRAESAAKSLADTTERSHRHVKILSLLVSLLIGVVLVISTWGKQNRFTSISLGLAAPLFWGIQERFRHDRWPRRWLLPGLACALLAAVVVAPFVVPELGKWLNEHQGLVGFWQLAFPIVILCLSLKPRENTIKGHPTKTSQV